MRRVLATDLGIWPAATDLHLSSDAMIMDPKLWSTLANYIVLYDQIVIPTGNFQIISVLRLILGEEVFIELLSSKAIQFVRFDHWFGYTGGGSGLVFFQIRDGNVIDADTNIATSYFKPIDQSIDVALRVLNPQTSGQDHRELSSSLIENTMELPTIKILNETKEESYSDISGSAYLRDIFSLRNKGRSLDNISGAKSDQVVFANPHLPKPPDQPIEISSLLRVTFENFLLSVGGYSQVDEITGDKTTLSILESKGQRLGFSIRGDSAFTSIQKVSGVPDIGDAFASKILSPRQILDLRYSKHARNFRDWLAKGRPHEGSDETLARYIETISQVSWIDRLPAKLLRFAITTGAGIPNPVVGAAVSAADSFLLSRWFQGKSPQLFMKQAKVMLANSAVLKPPNMKGRDRNGLCTCGSGKKTKHCCG